MMNWLTPFTFQDGTQLPCRLFPGPMDGVTEGSFLIAMSKRHFVRLWHTPFIRISTGVPRLQRLKDHLMPFLNHRLPVIAQIMGTDSERLAQTAPRLFDAGAACIDVNCACPSPTVLANHSGGFLLKYPEWLRQTLLALRDTCGNHPLSVKLRIGFDSPDEFQKIAPAVLAARPDMIFLHFRTVREMYRPVPFRKNRFQMARDLLGDIPMIACGDISSVEDALQLDNDVHPDGIAVARGLLVQPSLLRDIEAAIGGQPPPPHQDKIAFLLDIAQYAGRAPSDDNGFLLRLTKAMFGQNHEIFFALTHEHTIANSIQWLTLYMQQFR